MSKTLILVRSRIEWAITQERAKAQVIDEDIERLYPAAQALRREILSQPGYRSYDEAGESTPEARQISKAYDEIDTLRGQSRRHKNEADAYQRLLARVFGDSEIRMIEALGVEV